MARSALNCSARSMPSAIVTIPRVLPRSMTARATVASVALAAMRATNEWSSFTMSTGKSRKAVSGAEPAPKSSSASFTPLSCNSSRRASVSLPSRVAPWVSSRTRRSGAKAAAVHAWATSVARSGASSPRRLTLTLICSACAARNWICQWRPSAQACPSTQRCSGTIGLVLVDNALHQDRELVGAHPRHDVTKRDELAEAAADHPQQVVTGALAQRVVDQLEVIDIERQHRNPPARHAPLERVIQLAAERETVGQTGHRVVRRQVLEPLLHLFAVGDVADVEDKRLRARLMEKIGDGDLAMGPASQFVADAAANRDGMRRGSERFPQANTECRPILGMQQLAKRLPDEFVRGVGEKAIDRRAD